MSTGIEAVPASGRPRSPRDLAVASALLDLAGKLAATTYAAYLPVADRPALGVAMAVDTPCAFTIPSELDVDDLRLPTARAFQSGDLVAVQAAEMRKLTRQVPAHFLHNPFPTAVASVALVAGGRTFGCLSVHWSRTKAPDDPVTPEELQHLRRIAQKLAGELLLLADSGLPMDAPPIPLFIPPVPAESLSTGAPALSARLGRGLTGTTFLYQLKRLSAELAAAVHARDVLTAAQDQIMAPFGAGALMLCRVQDERLRVVGASGFSREEVGRVDGLPLSRSTPETDAVTRVEARLQQPSDRPAHTGTSHPAPALDTHPRAYMPLIANGRAIGCCILEFPAQWRRLPADEDIALAVLMLGQIGQTLERIHAHELEHALARTMQQSLLPPSLPLRPETVVTSRYLPATAGAAVGGDWYDIVPLPDGGIGLAIGDVEGHSVEAAGVMGHLRSAVLAYASEGHEPATVLERIDALLRVLGASRYATCCCLWLDPVTGVAKTATAGHPPPLISPAPGKLTALDVPVGPPLGLGNGHHYEQREIVLTSGSIIALFTDGLLETRALGLDAALARLADRLAAGNRENMDMLADGLISDRQRHKILDDDLALLLMRYDGVQPGEQQDVARLFVQRYDLQAVASTRHYLRDVLKRWGSEALLDDLQLMLSEVVTNALIHAQSDVDIRMRRHAGGVRVEVQDSSPQPPIPTVIIANEAMNAEAESGRGLLIVDALATAWGSSPAGRGKTTWIEMALPEQSS
ncbi:ATP-binding SpoIIE family protein phosphatase [Streptomyces cylindrosporus]|uniref:SpoIIE family protein phosphatase n=1 Tax=Streptomyces cylindrosporus TaxID=2927583 RepID=A0ABS9Y826_9ACTN|nr:ATP-binding SpoIIE family protein phosphatase [Streptomyces cylindrosporus]MCI3273383.1 SpoIIE family protein phosphatase [Streptomyces cylindrosporus]